VEVASKIADVLESSLEFLLDKIIVDLDKKTLMRLQDIEKLNEAERAHVFEKVDVFLRNRKTKKAYSE
jgi:hypothetical protein